MSQGCVLGEIAALVARPYTLAHRDERGREPPRLFRGMLKQMEGETLGRLAADPRQPRQLGDQLFDGAHRQPAANGSVGTFRISACRRSAARRCASATAASHEIAEELGVVALEDGRIDDHRVHHAAAIGGDAHHAAAGRGLDRPAGELGLQLLQPALHLLAELKELLKVCHALR